MSRFRVYAHRSGASRFGAASAPLKDNGELVPPFRSRFMAEALVKGLLDSVSSANISYTIEEEP